MAQKTNLNVSPYYDDFLESGIGAKDKNYYKVLFNPGKPIQARELNTLQSILQDQVETFGSHIFKEGSLVIPGSTTFDNNFYAVKLNKLQFGVSVSVYLSNLVGKTITGQNSGVSASVQFIQLPNSEVEYPTLYVKYLNSDSNYQFNPFQDNETLSASENIKYSTTTINADTPFATTISSNATDTGSAASIDEGVYFIRGTFVRVPKQTIVLDYYSNNPSYRVGLKISEEIISAKDDSSLYDNAKGFTNFAAPGADRFKISLTLTKKLLTDLNDTDFIEILRLKDGGIKKFNNTTNYNIIKDYLAQRTYDESGDYTVTPFEFTLKNSLNDRLGNDGLFFDTEKTDQGNVPSDDLMSIKFSPGKAYVRGYDIEKVGVEIIDVEKPRTTQTVSTSNVPFEMGNLLRVNNVTGSPKQNAVVYLQDERKNSTETAAGNVIGVAQVYTFNLTDSAYQNESTNWDLYLYDIQTYTVLTLNQTISSVELPQSAYVKGNSSGASGYAVSAGSDTDSITIKQTSGEFSVGEKITINGSESVSRTIKTIRVNQTSDIKSVHQATSISGFQTAFLADTQLDRISRPGIIKITNTGTATIGSPATFSGIKTGDIIRYQVDDSTETYNVVSSIDSSLLSMDLSAVSNVTNVCTGTFPGSGFSGSYSIGAPKIRNEEEGYLYAQIDDSNISSINLSSSVISFTADSNTTFTPSSGTLTVNRDNFTLGVNSTTAQFEQFDEERYSISYSDGTVDDLTPDKFSLSSNQVTFSGLDNKEISNIKATFVKNGIQSKAKQYNRSQIVNVTLSRDSQSGSNANNSINDGLTYNNQAYGLRVQDEEISLNYADVVKIIAIYESLDTSLPVLDKITFSSLADVTTNAIIGENIIDKDNNSIARVVAKPSSDTLEIVYLNANKFAVGDEVIFEESNIETTISSITNGQYRNITNKYVLNKGQKEQYYDYSRIVRRSGQSAPSRKITIVFDYYSVPSGDTGDLFTVNSYSEERFLSDIPNIGQDGIRASDTLDFRPRVSPFSGTTSSPFYGTPNRFVNALNFVVSPNESALIGYDFYLPRIDKLYLDKSGKFTVLKGIPSVNPKEPTNSDDVMELGTIRLPAYLYNPEDAEITVVDNRRYTMRDIGKIEDRVENLERVTSLSLLELNTKTLQIRDAQGLDRFKSGFFVDDFKNFDLINSGVSDIEIDTQNNELITPLAKDSVELKLVTKNNISDNDFDGSDNYELFDNNVQKTGEAITLKYEEVDWISQSFATQVENVNPFHIIEYIGTVKLTPERDRWVRTIRLASVFTSRTNVFFGGAWGFSSSSSSVDRVVASGREIHMRSRNTGFDVVNLKPLTRYYQFLDGNSGVDFIPKLIEIATDSTLENYGASDAFTVGETVTGSFDGQNLITFRVANSNHKEGPFNNPSITYTTNPYVSTENIPSSYSASSKTLNVDIGAISRRAQGRYTGYLIKGMRLVGQTSGAIAYVKDLRLISDINGFLSGSFFLRNPLSSPPPSVRIETGSKVYRLTSSPTNATPLPGSKLISSGESIYDSRGTWQQRQVFTTRTNNVFIRANYGDPLSQTFRVGGTVDDVQAPDINIRIDDANGAYLTAVDIFFANKDPGNAPITLEIRTVELGTPTDVIIGKSKTINPDNIVTSTNASAATKFTFDYPIYLAPGLEYAIVLLAPQSDQYEVWIAEFGEKTIETRDLPDSQAIKYGRQFAIGSLFKSQNGTTWTANQYQDMKFKLYKANFTSLSGSAFFHNPSLDTSNDYIQTLDSDPLTIVPREVKLGITTLTDSSIIGILTAGRKISTQLNPYTHATIVGTGASVVTVGITTGGSNYVTDTDNEVTTFAITGKGSGLTLDVGASGGFINSAVPVNYGSGYQVGDVVGIVTANMSSATGRDARITISGIGTGANTLFVSNVQGDSFAGAAATLTYYDDSGVIQVATGTTVNTSTPTGGVYSGNFFKVDHYNHGMYSSLNKVKISNAISDVKPTTLANKLLTTETSILLSSATDFGTFEGLAVDANNPGYLKIGDEIIKYTSVVDNTITGLTRGIDSTIQLDYENNTPVYKYELGGVSLRRINKEHNINSIQNNIDSYYISFDRTNFDSNVIARNSDQDSAPQASGSPLISFNQELVCGGSNVTATENIQFNVVNPHVDLLSPNSSTSASAQIRSISGTSVDGNETSFIDQGYESVELGTENRLSSTRIVCSNVNEDEYLDGLLRNKSFTLKVDLETTDPNISPIIFWDNSSVEFISNRLNSPISNYSTDNRVNSSINDPHSAIYVSNTVRLANPATSLKVILSAYRHSSSSLRVLYSLIRPDSSEIEQSFELFPGFDNLTIDNNTDGFLDVVDPSKNSGLQDVRVPSSLEDEFREYEYSVNNLDSFVGYTIKIVMSGTDQAYSPRIKDLRTIALA